MVPAIRCHRQNMKTSIINGSEVSSLPVAIHIDELKIVIEDYIRYYNTRRISLKFKGLSPVEYRLKSYPGRN
ncbi:TPA: hypothetical protein MHW50_25755 [Klebsiella pneumoniae]|nr:hypothetical protein [Klebsiella pneumoniae]HBX3311763.1 hypothetical protein [Klebsiella pneumoniae]HBX3350270.1 hypothetical protein [Klebsiella pneumoniae]HBY5327593.1 hypothetical protein [Klebsiella pneumoniae]